MKTNFKVASAKHEHESSQQKHLHHYINNTTMGPEIYCFYPFLNESLNLLQMKWQTADRKPSMLVESFTRVLLVFLVEHNPYHNTCYHGQSTH